MKNLFITISLCLLIVSCGPSADTLLAPKGFIDGQGGIQTLEIKGEDIDTEMRSLTLLMYPLAKDLAGFEYIIDFSDSTDPVTDSWNKVLPSVPYRDRLVLDIVNNLSNGDKVAQMVSTMIAVGAARDRAFRSWVPLDIRNEAIKTEIKEINSTLKPKIRKVVCFYEKKPPRGQKYDCRTKQDDVFKKKKKARRCKEILEDFAFVFETQEEEDAYQQIQDQCVEVENLQEENARVKEDQEPLEEIRKAGEGVVLHMLQTAEVHQGEKVFVATGASKEKEDPNGGPLSSINIQPEAGIVRDLVLSLDFGLNYSGGSGYKIYSVENGGITQLRLIQEEGSTQLKFNIVTLDFVVRADLSMTHQRNMGLRFVGEIKIEYPNGDVATGGMKLEFDTTVTKPGAAIFQR